MASVAELQRAIPVLDLKAQYEIIQEEIQTAIDAVLQRQHFILGPEVEKLEQEIAKYCGCRFGVGVASGTDALILGLRACGIGPGDEVIVPSFTFIATADTVSLVGATPVFADIDPETFNIGPRQIQERITSRTKAVIPVHLYGQAADMEPILALAKAHNLKIIEDSAQAIGATYRERRVNSLGNLGCISFFPSKNLGAYGDGGMVVTDSQEIYSHLRSLRSHGSRKKYFSEEQGWNSRLDELQAAILRVKLRHLDQWIGQRQAAAERYDGLLKGLPGVMTPKRSGFGSHVFHQYTIRVPHRDQVQQDLAGRGVSTMIYYPIPIHLQPIYAHLGYRRGDLPVTEQACEQVLSLPMFPELLEEQSKYVAEALGLALANTSGERKNCG